MTERRRGIVDPWRHVEPLRQPKVETPARERVDLEDIDLDADLAIPGSYVLRSQYVNFALTSVLISTPRDALGVLASCIVSLWATKPLREDFVLAGIGVRCGSISWNVPRPETRTSTLQTPDAIIWFKEKDLDQGMLDLGQILRRPEASSMCKKHGVVVMLTG